MARQEVDVHHRTVGEVIDLIEAGYVGHSRTRTDVNENPIRCQELAPSLHLTGGHEPRMRFKDMAVLQTFKRPLDPAIGKPDDVILARFDALHIDFDVTGAEAILRTAAGHMRGICTGDQGFGRCAARVDAGAAEATALDDGDPHA